MTTIDLNLIFPYQHTGNTSRKTLRFLLVSLLLLTILPAHAQIEKTLRKEFGKSAGVRGIERVFIETNLRDTIRNGIYELSTFQQIQSQSRVIQSKVYGQYSQDKKNGRWKYTLEDYYIMVDSLINRKPAVHVEGKIRSFRFGFQQGVPDSVWTARIDSIRQDTVFKTNTKADMDWDSLRFSYVDKTIPRLKTVDGYLTPDGFMNGTWTIEYDHEGLKFEEKREYIKGFLVGYALKELSSGIIIEEEIFQEVFSLLEQSHSDSTAVIPDGYAIDTFEIEDLDLYDLATSTQMNFDHAAQWIRAAHHMMFEPHIPGGKRLDVGGDDFFRTRMYRRILSQAQIATLDHLQHNILPNLKDEIIMAFGDSILQKYRVDNDSISKIYTRLEILLDRMDTLAMGIRDVASDSFEILSVRPIDSLGGFRSEISTMRNNEKWMLHTFRTQSNISSDPAQYVSQYLTEIQQIVANDRQKLNEIRQRIIDIEKLIDLENTIKKEVDAVKDRYEALQAKTSGTDEDSIGFRSVHRLVAHINETFVNRQLDAQVADVKMSNDVSTRERMGLAVLDYIQSLNTQSNVIDQIQMTAIRMDSLFTNERGKRMHKHLYAKAEALWNIKLDGMLKQNNWMEMVSSLQEANAYLQALQAIGQVDPKEAKSFNKSARKAKDLQTIETLILSGAP